VTSTATDAASARPAAGARAADVLAARMPEAILARETEFGEVTVHVDREHLVEVMRTLRDDEGALYIMPVFVTAVDWPDREPDLPRFDLVYQLRSLMYNDVCRVVVRVSDGDAWVPTLERVFAGMDWHERETFDLFGIDFRGHHDLMRILLPDDWDGHPLRKDYISFGEPVAFTHNIVWALPMAERPDDMPGAVRP
jgi:NADH-quinone oxidoreductase subunit C